MEESQLPSVRFKVSNVAQTTTNGEQCMQNSESRGKEEKLKFMKIILILGGLDKAKKKKLKFMKIILTLGGLGTPVQLGCLALHALANFQLSSFIERKMVNKVGKGGEWKSKEVENHQKNSNTCMFGHPCQGRALGISGLRNFLSAF